MIDWRKYRILKRRIAGRMRAFGVLFTCMLPMLFSVACNFFLFVLKQKRGQDVLNATSCPLFISDKIYKMECEIKEYILYI